MSQIATSSVDCTAEDEYALRYRGLPLGWECLCSLNVLRLVCPQAVCCRSSVVRTFNHGTHQVVTLLRPFEEQDLAKHPSSEDTGQGGARVLASSVSRQER